MPTWLRLSLDTRWLVGVSILSLIAVGLLLAVEALRNDEGTSAAVQVEARVAVVRQVDDGLLQVAIFDSANGNQRSVGSPDSYSALAWSPTGAAIAALAPAKGPGEHPRIHFISAEGGSENVLRLPVAADPVFPSWSPDGSRLAIAGARIYILAADATILSETNAPERGGSQASVHSSGGFSWSADSKYFGTVVNGVVMVIQSSGESTVRALSDMVPDVINDYSAVLGWKSDTLVLEMLTASGVGHIKIRFESGNLAATLADPSEQLPRPNVAQDPSKEVLAEAKSRVPNGDITGIKLSADHSFEVLELRPTGEATDVLGSPVAIVVRDPASGAATAVPVPTIDTRGGWLYDVFAYATKR